MCDDHATSRVMTVF